MDVFFKKPNNIKSSILILLPTVWFHLPLSGRPSPQATASGSLWAFTGAPVTKPEPAHHRQRQAWPRRHAGTARAHQDRQSLRAL